jgi:4-carboxymuconolactone decarboxylase
MGQEDPLDPETLSLVRFAAAIAQGDEPVLKEGLASLREARVPTPWVEELLLQSLLMVGYPRTLIAFRAWRKAGSAGNPGSDPDQDYARWSEWVRRGEATCRVVYGENYEKLRENIRSLHPALDAWMIAEGYGRTLARPGLDLVRRELCVVAQVAVLDAPRQLHSHLRGALNAGATLPQVEAVLSAVNPLLGLEHWKRVKHLWEKVREAWVGKAGAS